VPHFPCAARINHDSGAERIAYSGNSLRIRDSIAALFFKASFSPAQDCSALCVSMRRRSAELER
jgi:hypothetical protein